MMKSVFFWGGILDAEYKGNRQLGAFAMFAVVATGPLGSEYIVNLLTGVALFVLLSLRERTSPLKGDLDLLSSGLKSIFNPSVFTHFFIL